MAAIGHPGVGGVSETTHGKAPNGVSSAHAQRVTPSSSCGAREGSFRVCGPRQALALHRVTLSRTRFAVTSPPARLFGLALVDLATPGAGLTSP